CDGAVRMWVGPRTDRTAARAVGLEADRGRIMVDAISREAELEEVTDALLLTRSDDFNTLGAAELRNELGHGHVYRVAPDAEAPDLLPPSREAGIFGDRALTFAELDRRFRTGARIEIRRDAPGSGHAGADGFPLFAVTPKGQLSLAAAGRPPRIGPGDAVIVLASPEKAI